jgi:hypothetical protein
MPSWRGDLCTGTSGTYLRPSLGVCVCVCFTSPSRTPRTSRDSRIDILHRIISLNSEWWLCVKRKYQIIHALTGYKGAGIIPKFLLNSRRYESQVSRNTVASRQWRPKHFDRRQISLSEFRSWLSDLEKSNMVICGTKKTSSHVQKHKRLISHDNKYLFF